ncbi:hypothetical protein BGZ95_008286 [Linnemannia exigua]|uniref:Barwin domain-containing protein n=1 Tax=Linnemannia exigua TaxID=604196 RepID=A0AAD4DN04_9FUNG|nr:hypothetical protein BGZ95_008286 [Linnemannia exigua]
MKAIQVSNVPLIAVVAVANMAFTRLLSVTEARPFVNEAIATSLSPGEFIVNIRQNNNTVLNCGSCSPARLPDEDTKDTPLHVKPKYQLATARLEALSGGPEAVCNQCVMIRNAIQTRIVMVRLVADCPTCEDRQIELTPAAYNALEGSALGFMSFVPCPDSGASDILPWIGLP